MKAKLKGENFNRLIKATKDFVKKDEWKLERLANMIKIEFSKENNTATAVACNGYMLSCEVADCFDRPDEDFSIFIPPVRMFPAKELVTVEVVGKDCIIRCGREIVGYEQRTDGSGFIDYKKFIKQDGEIQLEIGFNPDYLIAGLKAAKESMKAMKYEAPAVLRFTDSEKAVYIHDPKTNKDSFRMVLPIHLSRGDVT